MADLDKAHATHLANIQKRSGKSLSEIADIVKSSGLTKHSEMVALLKKKLGLGHGDANTVAHLMKKASSGSGPAGSTSDFLDSIYSGPKASLRPIHDELMAAIRAFGPFEEAPKKSYISLRRSKQFATIGPATKTRVEVGLNMKGIDATERLRLLPAGQMCNFVVRLTDIDEVNSELLEWIHAAYKSAG